jgi:hypothetical protein
VWQIGVWEEGEGLSELAAELVGPERAQIHSVNHPGLLTGEILDLLVVSPSAVGWAGAAAIYCRTVLLPDSAGLLARSLLADRAVSYGLSGRDTITLSSLEENRICVAVQREIIRLDGGLVERQELVLPRKETNSTELTLAQVGMRLLLETGV